MLSSGVPDNRSGKMLVFAHGTDTDCARYCRKWPRHLEGDSMKRTVIAGAMLLGMAAFAPARAQLSDDVVKIGVLTDMSSLYSDINGPGAVAATQMAIDDF